MSGRSRRRELATLLACHGIMVAGLALSFPFFALYLYRERGVPMGLVGLSLSLVLASTALSQAWGGELSDLHGPKTVMQWALAFRGAASLGLALAVRAKAPVAALVGIYLLDAFGGNFYGPAVRTWIADRYEPAERSTYIGYQRIAGNLGWAVGPALGGLVAQTSYPLLFSVSAAACAFCWALLRSGIGDAPAARGGESFVVGGILQGARDPRLLEYCAYTLAITTVMTQLVASLSVHCVSVVGLTERQVGLLFGLNGAIVALFQAPLTRLLRRGRLSAALSIGCALYAAGYGWVGFARSLSTMAAAVAVVTFGEVSASPSLYALAANLAPAGWRGRYVGLHGVSAQAGQALGPLLGGMALQHVTPWWAAGPWLLVAGLACVAAAGFARFGRRLSEHEEGLAPLSAAQA